MTRSKGPTEELSLPPTRMRKDVSTANEGEENAQGQVQANVQSQQRTVDMPSPFQFQISDHRQRTQENWSESTRFRTILPQLSRITQNSLKSTPQQAD